MEKEDEARKKAEEIAREEHAIAVELSYEKEMEAAIEK